MSSTCAGPTGATESWDTVQLQSFTSAPVLVTQIQTANNEQGPVPSGASQPWLTAVANTVTSSSFLVALDSAETQVGSVTVPETVGYVAMAAGGQGDFLEQDRRSTNKIAEVSMNTNYQHL